MRRRREITPAEVAPVIQNGQAQLTKSVVADAQEVIPQVEATTAANSSSCERAGSRSRHGGALPHLP